MFKLALLSYHISQCLVHNLCISCEKEPVPPPGADYGRRMYAAGLLGQRFFLKKIQNGGRRLTLDLFECLR